MRRNVVRIKVFFVVVCIGHRYIFYRNNSPSITTLPLCSADLSENASNSM